MPDKFTILDRIKKHYDIKSNVELATFLGVTPQTISNWYSRNTVDHDKVLEKCADTDLNWLLLGVSRNSNVLYSIPPGQSANLVSDVTISYDVPSDSEPVIRPMPLYRLNVADGLVAAFTRLRELNPLCSVMLPGVSDCDGAVCIEGDGLLPSMKNGDLLIYKVATCSVSKILPDAVYILSFRIDGEEFMTVTTLRKGRNNKHLRLVNPDRRLPYREVALEDISMLVRIVANVRYNPAE